MQIAISTASLQQFNAGTSICVVQRSLLFGSICFSNTYVTVTVTYQPANDVGLQELRKATVLIRTGE